jgi:hypothetical protein
MENDKMKELIDRLNRHDWSYDFSEDVKKWSIGNENEKAILRLVQSLGGAGMNKYNELAPKFAPKLKKRVTYVQN